MTNLATIINVFKQSSNNKIFYSAFGKWVNSMAMCVYRGYGTRDSSTLDNTWNIDIGETIDPTKCIVTFNTITIASTAAYHRAIVNTLSTTQINIIETYSSGADYNYLWQVIDFS